MEGQPLLAGQAGQNAGAWASDPSGKYKLVMQGAFSAVECAVTAVDGLKSDGGSMLTMSQNIDLTVSLEGGACAACCRCCCAGESAFFNHYALAPGQGERGDVLIAPPVPGDIMLINMDGKTEWAVQKGSFLCADHSVSIGVMMQGLGMACCSGEGLFILKATGNGRLLLNSYGSIMRYDLQPGETRKIDNGFLVAWTNSMHREIGKAGKSLAGSFLSGEGLVTKFTGPGTVYVQTRSLQSLASALIPYLPSGGGGGGGDGA